GVLELNTRSVSVKGRVTSTPISTFISPSRYRARLRPGWEKGCRPQERMNAQTSPQPWGTTVESSLGLARRRTTAVVGDSTRLTSTWYCMAPPTQARNEAHLGGYAPGLRGAG